MKNMNLLLSIVLFIASCGEEEITKQQKNSIYGTWRLTASTSNNVDGSPRNGWQEINYDYDVILNFKENLRFESSESNVCRNNLNEGTFSLSTIVDGKDETTNVLEISINNCDRRPDGSFVRVFHYSFIENDLILIPVDPACDEGCAFRYSRVNE